MEALLNKPDWNAVNTFMLNKGWEFNDSQKYEDENSTQITWAFEKNYYSDEAVAWLYLILKDESPEIVLLSFFNSEKYTQLLNSVAGRSYKKKDSEIEDSKTTTHYENRSHYLSIGTESLHKENYSQGSNSSVSYSITLMKKGSVFDENNGNKTEYWQDGTTPKYQYTMVDGEYNGKFIIYYESGQIQQEKYIKNGKTNGQITEYFPNGNISYQFNTFF